MGDVADAARAGGAWVTGVIPESLMQREVGHRGLDELHVVPSMHARKHMMAERAHAFVALPGGLGTFEELFEVWTWRQLGYHARPDRAAQHRGLLRRSAGLPANRYDSGFVSDPQARMLIVERIRRRCWSGSPTRWPAAAPPPT
jgi:uncharacterized protein (TIGR00730 family)